MPVVTDNAAVSHLTDSFAVPGTLAGRAVRMIGEQLNQGTEYNDGGPYTALFRDIVIPEEDLAGYEPRDGDPIEVEGKRLRLLTVIGPTGGFYQINAEAEARP